MQQHSVIDPYIVDVADTAAFNDVMAGLALDDVVVTNTWDGAFTGLTALLPDGKVEALRNRPGVLSVETDQRIELSETQGNAPWNLDRLDQRSLPLTSTFSYGQTGAGVTAYVIDSGIRPTHVDFGGRRVNRGAYWDFGDGTSYLDCNGHGTHVAGPSAARRGASQRR